MEFPCVSMKIQIPKCITIKFLLNLVTQLKMLLMAALTHLRLLKPTVQEAPYSSEEATASTNYVFIMDGPYSLSPVPVPVHVLTTFIKNRLPVIEYARFLEKSGTHEREEEEEDEKGQRLCPVCLDYIEARDEIRELCNCSHMFHRDCLDRWVDEGQVTCPFCRSMLFPLNIDRNSLFNHHHHHHHHHHHQHHHHHANDSLIQPS